MAESAKFEALCTLMLGQKCGLMLGQKCGLCEINNTSYKCLNCDKKICITCMKIHLKSKASSDHKIEGLQSEDVYENIWKPEDLFRRRRFHMWEAGRGIPPLSQERNNPSASHAINVKIAGSFNSDKSRVVTTGNDQAWLWCWGGRDISLVTSDGKVLQNIKTDFEISDAAVSKSGDLLVTACIGNKVRKLIRIKTFRDIYTAAEGYKTLGMTVTNAGNVLVVLHNYYKSKIAVITTSGQHIRTIQRDIVSTKLRVKFGYDSFICFNINGDIIVLEGSVVHAVSRQGQRRFIYPVEERELMGRFSLDDVVTDKHGHIIISDYYNSVLHVLDSDGKFVQYLMTPEHGCDRPVGLDIDSSGRLWVCNAGNQQILIVEYA